MYIFYDFETSSRELLGQILSYAFILTDTQLTPLQELTGKIKLNRTQLPEIEAILVNKLPLDELEKTGLKEYEAASHIFTFLNHCIKKYGYCTLVGYNSNNFDLNFLRNLLIRYGFNPYFKGQLLNLDLLHYVQHQAFTHPDTFPWQLGTTQTGASYYEFTLESTAKNFHLLDTNSTQTHDAIDDVYLSIELTKRIQSHFAAPLAKFRPIQFPTDDMYQGQLHVAKQKSRHYPEVGEIPQKFTTLYWHALIPSGKNKLLVNLNKYENLLKTPPDNFEKDPNTQYLNCLKYLNPNKQFCILEPITANEAQWAEALVTQLRTVPFFKTLTLNDYFKLIKKDWDIEYQIHELGFERIDKLKPLIDTLIEKPESYENTLHTLLSTRKDPKDNYLIQLYNRAYLNTHPTPRTDYLAKYIRPRYITGQLLKDPSSFKPLHIQLEDIERRLTEPELTPLDTQLLYQLHQLYSQFITTHAIPEIVK